MASRFDSSTQGGGRKMLQWVATQDEAGVGIHVEALAGAGDFELRVTIVGDDRVPRSAGYHRAAGDLR